MTADPTTAPEPRDLPATMLEPVSFDDSPDQEAELRAARPAPVTGDLRYLTCEGSDDPTKRCGRHHPTELASITGGYECCCGRPWNGKESKCLSGAKTGDHVAPVTGDLRNQIAEAVRGELVGLHDDVPASLDVADAVVARLVSLLPLGDLPERMTAELLRHYPTDADPEICECGQPAPIDWDKHLAAAALSVRWEAAVVLAAKNARLRARAEHAESAAQVNRERETQQRQRADTAGAQVAALQREVDRLADFGLKHRAQRDDLAKQVAALRDGIRNLVDKAVPRTVYAPRKVIDVADLMALIDPGGSAE